MTGEAGAAAISPHGVGAAARLAVRVTVLNAPFALALAGMGWLPEIFQPFVVGAILFLIPGLAWTNLRADDGALALFRIVVVSLIASLATWLVLMVPPGPTERIAFILTLAAITNAGVWFGARRGWFDLTAVRKPLPLALMAVAGLFYIQSYAGAAYFIPPLEDQDMETQGTAYGIIHEGQPTMATNRDTRFFFAHPLLLHFWIGESALISNDLDRLRHYHEEAAALEGVTSSEVRAEAFTRSFARFEADPVLVPARTPNIFLGLLVIFPLGFLVHRLSGSSVAAVGAGVLYATIPEIYARSAYGGYLAVTNFLLVSSAYLYLHAAGLLPGRAAAPVVKSPAGRLGFVAAFLSGWADQKAVLMPMAAPVHAGLRALLDLGPARVFTQGWKRPDVQAALVTGIGFAVGWAVFAAYGLLTAPQEFVQDHLKGHIVDRLSLTGVDVLPGGPGWYPSVVALWIEFFNHTGWFLIVAAIPAATYALTRFRHGEGLLLAWAAIGFVGFSLVDWRQTKHLAHILPAMVMMTAVYWASLKGRLRMAFSALLVVAIVWNAVRTGLLMADFGYLTPTPIW
jgi:hypothetical protein